jgi:catechol 2,3-dioxygenase-like lactoylglutathione lyase family enzyme
MESKQTVQALKAHLALNVRNVEQSIEFYKKMLGIEPSKVRPGYAKFDVQNPPLNLTLNEAAFSERGALSHQMGHQHRCGNAFARHVSDHEHPRAIVAVDEIAIVPTERAGRLVMISNFPTVTALVRRRQKSGLNLRRQLQILFKRALFFCR